MTSKRSRKIRRSKGGRPRKEGERYPNGDLKPKRELGNERVRDWRAAALGSDQNLERADSPVSLALARGWLTEGQARTADEVAKRYRRFVRWFRPPALSSGGLREATAGSGVDKRSLQDMTDAEKTAVFDMVFNVRRSGAPDTADAALAGWQAVSKAMTPAQRSEVFAVCIQQSWPQWINWRLTEPQPMPHAGFAALSRWLVWAHRAGGWERGRVALVGGLDAVAELVAPPRKPRRAAPEQLSLGQMATTAAARRGPMREEVTTYTDQDGATLYEVVRRSRSAA
jgi:hypothetical protein